MNQTSLLLKPQYGSNFSKDLLTAELNTFVTYVRQFDTDGTSSNFPEYTPTINEKHILLQFESPEDTSQAKALFDQYKGNFLKGTYTDAIL